MSYFYKAYNLQIRSTFPLPEMLPVDPVDAVDVTIRSSSEGFPPLDPIHPLQVFPEGVVYRWYRVGTVLIRDGREIIFDPLRATHTDGTHFINLSRLVTQVPIRRLRRTFAPGELALLPEIVAEDLASL